MSSQKDKETQAQPVETKRDLFKEWMVEMGEVGKRVEEYVTERHLGPNTERALLAAGIKPFHFFKLESVPKLDGGVGKPDVPLAVGSDNTLVAVKHMMKRDCPGLYRGSRIELISKGDYSFVCVTPEGWEYNVDEFKAMCRIARSFGSDWDKKYRNWGIRVKE